MPHESLARNPFMLMLNPEVVLAAVERSEKLGRLARRTCHPLDRPQPAGPATKDTRRSIDDDEIADRD